VSPIQTWVARNRRQLDQRGTGRSTPVGEIPGETPAAQAAYLADFRADSIVRDAELIRAELGGQRWSVLGQSFGGFSSMTYLLSRRARPTTRRLLLRPLKSRLHAVPARPNQPSTKHTIATMITTEPTEATPAAS
jgi:pimeloyl-ACP methyl ester carboxylesterase